MQAVQAGPTQQVHQNRLDLVISGVTNRHCLGRETLGLREEEAVAKLAGRLLQRTMFLARNLRHIPAAPGEGNAQRSGRRPDPFCLLGRFRAQAVIEMSSNHRELQAGKSIQQTQAVWSTRNPHQYRRIQAQLAGV